MNFMVRKFVTDEEKMRLYSLLDFSAKIQFEIISVLLMNFFGSNGELELLPSFFPSFRVEGRDFDMSILLSLIWLIISNVFYVTNVSITKF